MRRLVLTGLILIVALAAFAVLYREQTSPAATPSTPGVPTAEHPTSRGDSNERLAAQPPASSSGQDPDLVSPSRTPDGRAAMNAPNATDESGNDAEREHFFALTRGMLVDSIEAYLPSYELSSSEIDRLADSMVRLREAQISLRELPVDPEFAEERRALIQEIGEATGAFSEIMDMDPGEFTDAVQPEVGIDDFDPNEVVPDGEFIETGP